MGGRRITSDENMAEMIKVAKYISRPRFNRGVFLLSSNFTQHSIF